ncbi:MAG: dihydrofolate reductase family protein [Bacteroidota bacterium]
MRKLKLQVQVSIDGFIAGPNAEMDWMQWEWDDKLKNYVLDLTASVDCIVLGRVLAQGFITYWGNIAANKNDSQYEFAKKMTDYKKIIFTNTLEKIEADWKNTVLTKSDLVTSIKQLKQESGKDIIVYGGAQFVSALIKENLIDELHLFINPSAIGSGMPIFQAIDGVINYQLIASHGYDCGIVVTQYGLKNA